MESNVAVMQKYKKKFPLRILIEAYIILCVDPRLNRFQKSYDS